MKTTTRRSEAPNLMELARKFPDDASARAYLESIRWPAGPVCSHCGTVNHAGKIAENPAKKIRAGLWQCLNHDCYKTFTVTIGTVFEASKVGLSNWLIAWYLMCASKKGIAALELQRLLGIGSYRTAWFMCMRIRESLKRTGGNGGGMLVGDVEADATFIGGKSRNADRYTSKTAVLSMVERDGAVRSVVVGSETRATVTPVLAAHVSPTATLLTDGAHAYKTPGASFAAHLSVNHGKGIYVKGRAHTGTADAFHGLIKRAVFGTWHQVSPKYLHRYMAEMDFRFTRRNTKDGSILRHGLENLGGKRLKFNDLKAVG